MGVKQIYIDDLREEFVKDYVFPMFRQDLGTEPQLSAHKDFLFPY